MQAAQKGGAGVKRKRRRRRGAAAKANVSSTELSDLYEEKQVRHTAAFMSQCMTCRKADNYTCWKMCYRTCLQLFRSL